jgi:hypothetical protein
MFSRITLTFSRIGVNNLALHALTAAFAADHAIVDEKAARIAIAETAAD